MKCPKCDSKASCIDSRTTTAGMTRRRYRCNWRKGHMWSTLEVVVGLKRGGKVKNLPPLAPLLQAEVFRQAKNELRSKILAVLSDDIPPPPQNGERKP